MIYTFTVFFLRLLCTVWKLTFTEVILRRDARYYLFNRLLFAGRADSQATFPNCDDPPAILA